tara:strand:- start:69 stop:299 length:231 start_codon:yes stop_codon:yes gene_type:complete
MDNTIFVLASAISIFYIVIKFIEMRFIIKENKPLKLIVRDTLIVFISVIFGNFIMLQVSPSNFIKKPEVFTDNPGF